MTPPQSIQTLLASRVDQLPEPERDALTHAAVEGRLFHRRALHALADDDRQTTLDAALLALVRKQLDAQWDSAAVLRLLGRAKSLLDTERWLDVAVTYCEALADAESRQTAPPPLEETIAAAERAGRADVACLGRWPR